MAGTPQFVDMSAFQPDNIDWQTYKAWSAAGDGISRVAMRSSYGIGYTDAHFAEYRAGALAAGIDSILYYHYGYPNLNGAVAEANWQHSVVGDIRASDMLILDYEQPTDAATAAWAFTWLATQEANYGGKLPGIYASSYYISQHLQDQRLAKYPLWLANWEFTPNERPPVPSPWAGYEFVQYSDRASIPGIPGVVDADIFLGGTTPVNNTTYGPHSADFAQWFSIGADGNWTCKQTHAVLQGGNKDMYSQLSLTGDVLPVIGLPVENEVYHIDADGYHWSSQKCERAQIIYDPSHKHDGQPGMGASYLAHIDWNPPTTVVTKLPDAVANDIRQLYKDAGL